jgi:hypothetical protein
MKVVRLRARRPWPGFFTVDSFLRAIVAEILRAWSAMTPPAADALENQIRDRLVISMNKAENRKARRFRVYPELHEPGEAGTRRIDLQFESNAPQGDDEFVSFECKRLRVVEGAGCKSRNADYVDGRGQGMTAYIQGRYPAPHGHAGMIGFVLCDGRCSPERSLASLMKKSQAILNLKLPALRPSPVLEADNVQASDHVRPLMIHHVLLAIGNCAG